MEEESWCEYTLFPAPLPNSAEFSHAEGQEECLGRLQVLIQECYRITEPFTEQYLWHRESFRLAPVLRGKSARPIPRHLTRQAHALGDIMGEAASADERDEALCEDWESHLYGRMVFGDNVDDEWFVLSLLREITRQIPGMCVSVRDSDGEFLLIEAASDIPRWLKPDTARHRVFLSDSRVHIIPLPSDPAMLALLPPQPSIGQALRIVRDPSIDTYAGDRMMQTIQKRISPFPQLSPACSHTAICFLPEPVARFVEANPQSVASAVHAFHYRDVSAMKACQVMAHIKPEPSQFRAIPVRFTHCLFAQLAQQEFPSPPAFASVARQAREPRSRRAVEIGMKLACGYEIACAEHVRNFTKSQAEAQSTTSPDSAAAVLARHPVQWERFQKSLEAMGYFGGQLEGSEGYRRAKTRAVESFIDFMGEGRGDSAGTATPPSTQGAICEGIKEIVRELSANPSTTSGGELADVDWSQQGDESWLTITEEELSNILKERAGFGPMGELSEMLQSLDGLEGGGGEEGEQLIETLNTFMNTFSSHEGAEVPRDTSTAPNGGKPSNPSREMEMLRELLGEEEAEESESSSEEEEEDGLQTGEDVKPHAPQSSQRSRVAEPTRLAGRQDIADTFDMGKFLSIIDEVRHDTALTMEQDGFLDSLVSSVTADAAEQEHQSPGSQSGSARESAEERETSTLQGVMDEMDAELASAEFVRKSGLDPQPRSEDPEGETEGLDMDADLAGDYEVLSSMLASVEAQNGMVGPVSNLLASMGMSVPRTGEKRK